MAFFNVTSEIIDRVWDHPHADRLDLAKVQGMDFQFVVRKGMYAPGDKVIYFPIDSVLPSGLIEALGLVGRLAGGNHDRIKTIKLRGEISQGLVYPPEVVLHNTGGKIPDDLTTHLGITKYEPPATFANDGVFFPLPEGIGVYDIEGAGRFAEVVRAMMLIPVQVTEKLEGSNIAAVREPDGSIYYCMRNRKIQEIPGTANTYAETARLQGTPKLLHKLAQQFPGKRLVLRGELLGENIQKNIYRLKGNRIRFFDLKVDIGYMDAEAFMYHIPQDLRVPVLGEGISLREWLDGQTIQEASNGPSVLRGETRREGIVVKTMNEMPLCFHGRPHRGVIKQRSPEYLAREK